GAKPVSPEGASGASTVSVGGKLVNASTMLAVAAIGKPVETVEHFDKADPVTAGFVAHDASQCGFCTPGFVMAVRAFLKKNPRPSEEQIRDGLNGNLCRCGTYANIHQLLQSVGKGGHRA